MVMPDKTTYTFGPDWYRFAIAAFAIHMVSIIIMVIFSTGKKKKAWAASADVGGEGKNVNLLACITPLIPVTLSVALGISAIFAIIISAIWALAWTGYFKNWGRLGEVVQKTFHEGVSDVGLVLGFLLFLQMFIKAAGADKALLAPIFSPIIPHSAFVLFLIFGLLSFMSLFRGPLTIWGRWRRYICDCRSKRVSSRSPFCSRCSTSSAAQSPPTFARHSLGTYGQSVLQKSAPKSI